MDAKEGLAVVETVLSQIPIEQRGEFATGIRGMLPELGTTALSDSVQTTEVVETPTVVELSPEQQEKALALTSAIAEKFGVRMEDFSVLKETIDGESRLVLAYTAGNGIHLGSWNKIFDKKNAKDFMIEIHGKKYDTRTGMTEAVYRGVYDYAKQTGQTLPDSRQLSDKNDEPWTWTLLTGEQADGLSAPIADVNGGKVGRSWSDRDDDGSLVRFRPAVVIE